jgi:hypothetical protein
MEGWLYRSSFFEETSLSAANSGCWERLWFVLSPDTGTGGIRLSWFASPMERQRASITASLTVPLVEAFLFEACIREKPTTPTHVLAQATPMYA